MNNVDNLKTSLVFGKQIEKIFSSEMKINEICGDLMKINVPRIQDPQEFKLPAL
jgi:hypothetical protein